MPRKCTNPGELTPQQILAVEHLTTGATVVKTAELVGVSRETVHRWLREDWNFQAAANAARRELHDAVQRRLLVMTDRALSTVAEAIDRGDLGTSLALLKRLGTLDALAPPIGSDDPRVLAEEAQIKTREAETARTLRRINTF